MIKSEKIEVRCTKQQKEEFGASAEREGLNSSQYLWYLYEKDNKKQRWFDAGSLSCRCTGCGCKSDRASKFCPNCGARMEMDEDV